MYHLKPWNPRKFLVSLSLFVFLLVGCATSNVFQDQNCPEWLGVEGKCKIRLQFTDQEKDVNLEGWDGAHLSIVGSAVINNEENIVITTEEGETLDPNTVIFTQGSYIVKKVDPTKVASFKIDESDESAVTSFAVNIIYAKKNK